MDHLNRPKRGRRRIYKTREKLQRAVDAYFNSISFLNAAKGPGGVHIQNMDGEPIWYVDYAVPPTIEDLSIYIGVTDRTWRNYRDQEWAREVCEDAETRIRAYRTRIASTAEKCPGTIFLLQNDSGMSERVQINTGTQGMSVNEMYELLRQVGQEMLEDESGED